jgi:hypothetical protein
MVVDILVSGLALYTKLPGVRCLIHVGREGWVSAGLGFTKKVVGQTMNAGSRTRTILSQMYLPARPFSPIVRP